MSATEQSDLFGRVTWKSDLGGHVTSTAYDLAGRMTGRTTSGAQGSETVSHAWLNTGLLGTITTDAAGHTLVQVSAYDANGNKLAEHQTRDGAVIQDAAATYDALGRLLTWSEAGNATTPAASMAYAYDANSNIRRMQSSFRYLDATGAATSAVATQDHWYRYDAMNRLVLAEGGLAGGVITGGRQISYDAAGQRIRVETVSSGLIWHGWKGTYKTNSSWIVYSDEPGDLQEDGYVWTQTGRSTYTGKAIESYSYTADGQLASVSVTQEGVSVDWGVFTPTGVMGASELRASFGYDALGRVVSQTEYARNDSAPHDWVVAYSRTGIVYDGAGRVTSETSTTRQGASTLVTNSSYGYGSGAGYALGAVVTLDADTWKDGSDAALPDTRTTYGYAWHGGAVQSANSNVRWMGVELRRSSSIRVR